MTRSEQNEWKVRRAVVGWGAMVVALAAVLFASHVSASPRQPYQAAPSHQVSQVLK